jgi:hypothetical protein
MSPMDFSQIIPFNPSNGGNTPNMCLANVIAGYGIAPKYGSAWEAWQHTQQHPDRNVPSGLAVPIFYAYTTTINGVTANYGHINVQLPNGTVWSDGNIYASIDAYMSSHSPTFVGWGESVNDYKIIQGGEEMPNDGDVINVYELLDGRPATPAEQTVYTNKSWSAPDGLYYGKIQVDIKNLQAAAANPPGVVPYSGPELFTKS